MLQVCHELSSWYICMTQGLVSHALGVPGLLSTITLVQVTHPRAFCHMLQVYHVYHQLSPWYIYTHLVMCTMSIIYYHPGTCIHVPGPSVTFSRHTRSIINYHPGTCCISLGLLSHAPGVPELSPWSNLHIPWPSVTCTRCTRPFHNMHIGPSYISVYFLQVV